MMEVDDARQRQSARRPKPRVSCILCRSRKLQCDRKLPCRNCRKRPAGSCTYMPNARLRGPQGPGVQSEDDLNHVHQSVPSEYPLSLAAMASHAHIERDHSSSPNNGAQEPLSTKSHGDSQLELILDSKPVLDSHDLETRLIDTTSWEAILRDIGAIESHVYSTCTTRYRHQRLSTTSGQPSQPSLLFGLQVSKSASVEDLVNSLPPRSATDQLVNLFANGLDIPALPIHLPTFFKDYQTFWDDPSKVTLPWLSILFSIVTLALQFVLRSRERIEGIPFIETACRQYVSKAAECLTRSDYAKPTSKTVEAMLMYLISEHTWLEDSHFRASLILSFAIRLAMRSGYHRDPSHYRQISLFDGEMRRRTWSHLVQLDLIFASILGLPRHISDHLSDTALPSNIADADLYADMTTLPPPCSPEQPSSIGFLNQRAHLTRILGQITDYTTSFGKLSYKKVVALDQALDMQAKTCPAWLKYSTFFDQVMDDTSGMNRALEIDILEQRARIILHRRFFTLARTNSDYMLSRDKCLAAATRVLQHRQAMSALSFKVDGMVVQNWRALSLMSQDFLLGAMVICLEFDQVSRYGLFLGSPPITAGGDEGFEERLALLKSYQQFLVSIEKANSEAQEAAHTIELVVSRVELIRDSSMYVGVEGDGRLSSALDQRDATPDGFFKSTTINAPDLLLDSIDAPGSPTETSEFLYTLVQGFPTGLDWNLWDFDDPTISL